MEGSRIEEEKKMSLHHEAHAQEKQNMKSGPSPKNRASQYASP